MQPLRGIHGRPSGLAPTQDVMQASVPRITEKAKVNDMTQGGNPIRIVSLMALPDSHVQDLEDE